MEKKIVIKCTKVDGDDCYNIQIIEQTHICGAFGNPSSSFLSSKGFTLGSQCNPALAAYPNKMYVMGSQSDRNNDRIRINSSALIRKIMHAIREYNGHAIVEELPRIPDTRTFTID